MKIGLLSDAHGSVEAFGLAVDVLVAEGATSLYFLGDAVGYLPGAGVLEAITTLGVPAVCGNHEAMLLTGMVDPRRDRTYRLEQTRRSLPAATLDEVRAWPDRRKLDAPCGPLLMVHGSPADTIWGYVYPDTDLAPFAQPPGTTVFMGNTHRPFVREHEGALFVNVGSCGLPRDCGAHGAACLFDNESGEATIVRFDIRDATERALQRVGDVAPEVLSTFQRRSAGPCFGEHRAA
jgi:predicted phosphodiesterase